MQKQPVIENDEITTSKVTHNENEAIQSTAPPVALWQTWGLRIIFAAMVIVLGSKQLNYILEGASQWNNWRGLGHSMLFTLAVLAIGGVFRPLAFLPLMIYEIAWKLVWLLVVALPPFLAGEPIPGIVSVKGSVIGICLIMVLIPWKYVWWRYFKQPIEPWRGKKGAKA